MIRSISIFSCFLLLPLSLLLAKPNGLTAEDVVVVYNSDLPESKQLAELYQQQRKVPKANLIGFSMPNKDAISRKEFNILRDTLRQKALQNKVYDKDVILLLRGVPFKIMRSDEKNNEASVDSELSANPDYDKLDGALKNFYYQQDLTLKAFKASLPKQSSLKLVTRIDGPSFKQSKQLILDSIATEKTGLWGVTYLDKAFKGKNYAAGDHAIDAIERLNWINGIPTVKETTKHTFPTDYPMDNAAVYFGWYTTHLNGPFLHPEFTFKKGAVASHLHSFSGSQLRSDATHWVGPLLAKGACAVLGNVHEPYLEAVSQTDVFYHRLFNGYSFAEAAYMATPALSWQTVMIGDPLYNPFKHHKAMKGEVAEEDKDFRVMTLLRTIHIDNDANMLQALRSYAAKSENAHLYEYIGLWNTYQKNTPSADLFYQAAARLAESESQKVRLALHRSYLQLGNKAKSAALDILDDTLSALPKASHRRALHSLRVMHDPPPPPKDPK